MKKHIMFVDENKIVNFSGGVERVICAMANEFVQRGYDVSIVCLDTEDGKPFFVLNPAVNFINLAFCFGTGNFDNYRWFLKKVEKEILRAVAGSKMRLCGIHFDDPKKKYFYREFILRLRNCIAKVQPDIILPIDPDSVWLALKAKEGTEYSQVKVLPMNHIDPRCFNFSSNNIVALRECNVTQSLLPAYVDTFHKIGVERVKVIPNIVPQFDDNELVDLSICRHRIIHVGRIDGASKRQHLLIEAFALLSEKYPSWTVSLFGEVANRGYKKKLDRLIKDKNISAKVKFEGVSNNIFDEYRKSDIFAFPSGYEGFGLAITEAMSIGLPVVAYKNCMTMASIIKDGKTGMLCDDGPEALAETLSKLIENTSLRSELGRQAHMDMKRYAAKIVWDKWEQLIKDMIA